MPSAELIIMDMDETLHDTPPLARTYYRLAAALAARAAGAPEGEGERVLEEARAALSAGRGEGFRATVSHTLMSLGISLREWIEARDAAIDPAEFVKRDEALEVRLRALAKRRDLAILTNNSRAQTDVVLRALGVERHFGRRIYTVDETGVLKPEPGAFLHVTRELGVDPGGCVMLGDRPSVDLEPAGRLGMRTLLVSPPSAIYGVLDGLIAEDREAAESAPLPQPAGP